MFQKLLVCTDGSESAQRAVEAALEIAQRFHAQVLLVNVLSSAIADPLLSAGGQALLVLQDGVQQRLIPLANPASL